MRTINTYDIPKEARFTLSLPVGSTIITIVSYERGFGMEYKLLVEEPDEPCIERNFVSIANHNSFDPLDDEYLYVLVGYYLVRQQPWVVYEMVKRSSVVDQIDDALLITPIDDQPKRKGGRPRKVVQ